MQVIAQVHDSSYGKPAVGVRARLARIIDDDWVTVAHADTDSSGRIIDWNGQHLERGLYQIVVDTDAYFAGLGVEAGYPEVIVIFRMRNESHEFHVNLTLAPHSYTAYCGTVDI